MSLAVTISNDKKIYNLTNSKSISELLRKHKRNEKEVKKDSEFSNRVEFIQNFEFPQCSNKIDVTEDGYYIIASGMYGPLIKIFDTTNLSLKCLRGLDSEVVDFAILDRDYKKLVMACADRNLEFHAQYGKHYKLRVPRQPRCLNFNRYTSDLFIGCSSSELYRLNLEEGKFLSNFETNAKGITTIHHNSQLDLLITGSEDGLVNFFDYRQRRFIREDTLNDKEDITIVKGGRNPFETYVGSAEGLVRVYDIRTERFVQEKRSPYMLPINSIEFHHKSELVMIGDSKSIRMTHQNDLGSLYAVFESKPQINNFKVFQDSGLIVYSSSSAKLGAIYVPTLGPVPKFCQFIENVTEELEDTKTDKQIENMKFVTYDELIAADFKELIGSHKLTPHLHGYLIAQATWDRLTAVF